MGRLSEATALSVQHVLATRDMLVKEVHKASEAAIDQIKEHETAKIAYLQGKVGDNIALKKVRVSSSFSSLLF